MKNKDEYVKRFQDHCRDLGRPLSKEDAEEEFDRLYRFMRLIFKYEHQKRMERFQELLKDT